MNFVCLLTKAISNDGSEKYLYETMSEWLVSFTLGLLILILIFYLLAKMSRGRTEMIAKKSISSDKCDKKIKDYLTRTGFKPVIGPGRRPGCPDRCRVWG